MKRDNKVIGLRDLVEGFLFSLQAEGRARRTHEYYDKLLRHFLYCAKSQGWSDRIDYLNAKRIREFLSWIGFLKKETNILLRRTFKVWWQLRFRNYLEVNTK